MGYTDDSNQLPALPDFGPRDGRHGVDRDATYDPYSARGGPGKPLKVSVDDAQKHFASLLLRVEAGEDVIVERDGIPIARLVPPTRTSGRSALPAAEAVPPQGRRKAKDAATYIDHGAHLLELPDSGPRDGRHGVDRDRGFTPPTT